MKRIKESGASFWKKKKAREEIQRKNTGAIFKYVSHEPSSTSSNIVAPCTGEEIAPEGKETFSDIVEGEGLPIMTRKGKR